MEVTSHKITLGVNWARLGSERDGEMDKEGGRERERGREQERAREREPGGLISDYNLALSKHKISLNPKEKGMIKDKRIGIKYKEL